MGVVVFCYLRHAITTTIMRHFWGYLALSLALLFGVRCADHGGKDKETNDHSAGQSLHTDKPFVQEYSVRYYLSSGQNSIQLSAISANRDNQIRILSDKGILVPDQGSLLYSGGLTEDFAYPQMLPKKISAITTYRNQTVFLDNKQIFSNGWAGKLQIDHGLPNAYLFAGGDDFHFLVSDGSALEYLGRGGEKIWSGRFDGLLQIKYLETGNRFLLVTKDKIAEYTPGQTIREMYQGEGITCASYWKGDKIVVGTTSGYVILPEKTRITKIPDISITTIQEIDGKLWFGSRQGAFRLNEDVKYSYYAGERWLPGNHVIALEKGPDHSVLVLTDRGVGQIISQKMTLEEKALFYEKQVREKNIRYGFNCSSVRLTNGYASAQTGAQPSDNLWTAMYLASQLYRYKVTGSQEAKENAYESFEAMERLFTVTGIQGLFARSIERDGKVDTLRSAGWEEKELASGSPQSMWYPAKDHANWTWRSTASSDQTVGQIFALTTILELADDHAWKVRALKCLDDLMGYIVKNDFYLIDKDGHPTLWGKWNPSYVNAFPENVGDRKLYSSNIIAFLQTAWHFTGKEIYKQKAIELMDKEGYLANLIRPFSQIGPSATDKLSNLLSQEWNHSDDEMYFLAYPGLFNYAISLDLKAKYAAAISDHWESERPEGDALWNFIYASTGAKNYDLERSVQFLQSYPLDLRNWSVQNSNRKDIELLPPNFRGQTTPVLLPLGELPLFRHNGEIFKLDSTGDGRSLISAGDVWLLPYWMGRYLHIII